jgi:hypothetical protein
VAKRQRKDLRPYAVVGAEHRLLELAEEAATIFAMFPELRAPGRGFMAKAGGRVEAAAAADAAPVRRRRRKISAAGRKRISDAQKARWAKQKAAQRPKK